MAINWVPVIQILHYQHPHMTNQGCYARIYRLWVGQQKSGEWIYRLWGQHQGHYKLNNGFKGVLPFVYHWGNSSKNNMLFIPNTKEWDVYFGQTAEEMAQELKEMRKLSKQTKEEKREEQKPTEIDWDIVNQMNKDTKRRADDHLEKIQEEQDNKMRTIIDQINSIG